MFPLPAVTLVSGVYAGVRWCGGCAVHGPDPAGAVLSMAGLPGVSSRGSDTQSI